MKVLFSLFMISVIVCNIYGFKGLSTRKFIKTSNLLENNFIFPRSISKNVHSNLMMSMIPRKVTRLFTTLQSTLSIKKSETSLVQTLKVGSLLSLWYALNIARFNIYNIETLNNVPQLRYVVAFFQLFLVLFCANFLRGSDIRKAPELNNEEFIPLLHVATLYSFVHLNTIVSLSVCAVILTHIVKAAEPAVSTFLSAMIVSYEKKKQFKVKNKNNEIEEIQIKDSNVIESLSDLKIEVNEINYYSEENNKTLEVDLKESLLKQNILFEESRVTLERQNKIIIQLLKQQQKEHMILQQHTLIQNQLQQLHQQFDLANKVNVQYNQYLHRNNYHNNLGLYGITQRGTVCKICKSKGQLCHMHIYRITDMSRLLQ